jgi:hypothetical protein
MSKYSTDNNANNNFETLIKEIKNSLDTHLKEMISKMFSQADDKLFELADSATSNEDQNRYFELVRDLRDYKSEISTDFLNNVNLQLKPFAEMELEKEKSAPKDESELSLIGQDEMEDMVMIKSIAGNAAGKFREAISHLEARLEHLALQTPDIFSKDALDPTNICQSFDDAMGGRFNIISKKIIFELFDNNVVLKLDTIYDAINNMLIDADVLPQIKLHAQKSTSKQGPTPTTEEYSDTEGDGEEQDQINQGGYAMTATPGHGNRGGGQAASGGGASSHPGGSAGQHGGASGASGGGAGGSTGSYQGGMDQQAGDSGAPAGGSYGGGSSSHQGEAQGTPDTRGGMGQQGGQQGTHGATGAGSSSETGSDKTDSGPSGSSNYQHNTAGLPASQVSDVIGEFMGAPVAPPPPTEGETSESYPAATQQFYGHDDVLSALSSIQINPEFSSSGELKFDAEAIKQAVLTEIGKTSGGVVTKRINRIAEKTIDFIELIFDAIIEDEDISDTIKALLLRLQIPVIKASMVDQEFFIYDDHPARVLLDKIAEVGIGVTEHSDEVYIELDKIITKLVNEFELQTSSFQEALDELNEFVSTREEAARQQEEETQRQVLREHARSTVLKSLRSVTTGKTLPKAIHALVLQRWPTLMYNHYLNHGKENDEWVTILETLRDIIHSVQPLKTAGDLDNLLNTRDKLVETTLEYLNRTNQSKKDIETVIQGLEKVHQIHIDNADFAEEELEPEQEAEDEVISQEEQQAEQITAAASEPETPEEEPAQEVEEEEPSGPRLPANIMPGMWFQVYMGEDSPLRRGKLSVIIVQDSKLVFVNYQGGIIVEKSFEEFIDELDQGKSKVIMGHSAFDHALNRVVTNLNK